MSRTGIASISLAKGVEPWCAAGEYALNLPLHVAGKGLDFPDVFFTRPCSICLHLMAMMKSACKSHFCNKEGKRQESASPLCHTGFSPEYS